MPTESAAAIRNSGSWLLKIPRIAGRYMRSVEEPSVCKSSLKTSTASFLIFSQGSAGAGLFAHWLMYCPTICFLVAEALCGGLSCTFSGVEPIPLREVAWAGIGRWPKTVMRTAPVIMTDVYVHDIFMKLLLDLESGYRNTFLSPFT